MEEAENISTPAGRPTFGIVLALILSVSALVVIINNFGDLLSPQNAPVYRPYPGLRAWIFFSKSIAFVGHSTIAIGAILSYRRHPKGNEIVRIGQWCVLIFALIGKLVAYRIVRGSVHWDSFPQPDKDFVEHDFLTVVLGAIVQSWLILFLFRRSKWP